MFHSGSFIAEEHGKENQLLIRSLKPTRPGIGHLDARILA
jgi:hypothetical protein